MKTALQPDAAALQIDFDDSAEIERFFGDASANQGFLLELEQPPRQYQTFRCVASGPDGFRFSFEAEAIQVFPRQGGVGAAFQLRSWTELKERELERRLASAVEDETSAGEQIGVSPIWKIKSMNPKQKARLAMRGSRSERQILLRDHNAEVLAAMLNHPRIEESEVLEIVKSAHSTGAILKRVADNSKWMQSSDIRVAVVRSPKTPHLMAVKYLPSLPTTELQTLSKMGNAREMLRKEALKIYLQRMGGKNA